MVKLDIVIVNWNAGQQLRACLDSIVTACRDGFALSLVVVDNASSDGSVDDLNDLDLPLTMIQNDTNRGFATACNQGAKGSDADYLLFLNPDTRLFKDSLDKPLAFMEQQNNRQVGIVGIQLVDEIGQISRTCARFLSPGRFFANMMGLDRLFPRFFLSHFMSEWDHGQTREVDQVMGAFFLTRRSIFETLGGFDERFFVYFEDIDFSLHAYKHGWKTVYLAEAQAYHKGGGTSEQVKATRLFYSLRSRIQYGYKHFGWFPATFLLVGTLLLEPLARLALAAGRRSGRDAVETLAGFGQLWASLPALILGQDRKR
ncbi:MAG TPA: glycosyltransferase family 2 protein [Candidatus Limnocylindrales bacterium]|nr:glycosyltransferase family 2 protein [Candidatus Limnocylindrales bacterium]